MEIKRIRNEKGYTQEFVASALGIDQSSYCLKENGYRSFKIEELLKLKEVLETTIDELIKGE